ncbi:MAG: dTMP kinase [Betaproteobacteria bacterium RIFCSPLOWO2_02_FULL_65_24]|nr:MAG: dTMP kinase [Betaproteobacteria bacterium RIFCSPLOWO2_02_FULL_65_24]OGA87618.1 MAG: dTMP kinase [Betaproteobacteria bacterium RIFCSPLOWO2_12_FULL_66_14]
MKGRFITLEGVDGAGKSSHVQWIADFLREKGHEVVETREPGGTVVGERLRDLLLAEPMEIETEALLMFAARREHITRVILPALSAGRWVVSDRFTDATYAYQGGGRGLAKERIALLETWVQGAFQPDLTLVFDVTVEVARRRLQGNLSSRDRFEEQDAAFFERVRAAYLERARAFPARIRVIDSDRAIPEVRKTLEEILSIL